MRNYCRPFTPRRRTNIFLCQILKDDATSFLCPRQIRTSGKLSCGPYLKALLKTISTSRSEKGCSKNSKGLIKIIQLLCQLCLLLSIFKMSIGRIHLQRFRSEYSHLNYFYLQIFISTLSITGVFVRIVTPREGTSSTTDGTTSQRSMKSHWGGANSVSGKRSCLN